MVHLKLIISRSPKSHIFPKWARIFRWTIRVKLPPTPKKFTPNNSCWYLFGGGENGFEGNGVPFWKRCATGRKTFPQKTFWDRYLAAQTPTRKVRIIKQFPHVVASAGGFLGILSIRKMKASRKPGPGVFCWRRGSCSKPRSIWHWGYMIYIIY